MNELPPESLCEPGETRSYSLFVLAGVNPFAGLSKQCVSVWSRDQCLGSLWLRLLLLCCWLFSGLCIMIWCLSLWLLVSVEFHWRSHSFLRWMNIWVSEAWLIVYFGCCWSLCSLSPEILMGVEVCVESLSCEGGVLTPLTFQA